MTDPMGFRLDRKAKDPQSDFVARPPEEQTLISCQLHRNHAVAVGAFCAGNHAVGAWIAEQALLGVLSLKFPFFSLPSGLTWEGLPWG